MRWAVALLTATLLLSGCTDDKEQYCEAVEDRQQELGEVLGEGGPDALLRALPIFRDLSDEAPSDIRDEWRTVIRALEGLQDALEEADVDPAAYDPENPREGLEEDDRAAIEAAATELASQQTVAAFNGVDQQAKDVCGTPLLV